MAEIFQRTILNPHRFEHPTDLRTWAPPSLLLGTLAAYIPPFGAFSQHDWPVPKGYIPGIALRTFHSLPTVVPFYVNFGPIIKKATQATAAVAQRQDIARAEQATLPVARRVDD